jgi:hypothetical protein
VYFIIYSASETPDVADVPTALVYEDRTSPLNKLCRLFICLFPFLQIRINLSLTDALIYLDELCYSTHCNVITRI